MRALVILASLSLALSACSSKKTSSGCTGNTGCDAGEVCVSGVCETLCASDSDCDSSTICEQQICIPGQRGDAPQITEVDADGSPDNGTDPAGTVAAHHLATEIIVRGSFLAGADVAMTGSAGTAPVTIASSSDTELVLAVADTMVEGQYTLTVSNAVGSDQATVWVLRGEQGEQGVAGAQGPAGVAGVAGSPGDLIAWYEFDEASGTTFADSTAYGNNAVSSGSGIAEGSGGHSGNAIAFSGGVVTVGAGNSIPDAAQIYVEAWIQPAAPLTGTRTIVDKDGAYAIKQVDDEIAFVVVGAGGSCTVQSIAAVAAGNWYHVAGWYDGLAVSVSLDGNALTSTCRIGPIEPTAGGVLHIGGFDGGTVSEAYAGRIDELRIRNTAPSSHRACPVGFVRVGPTCIETDFSKTGTPQQAIEGCYAIGAELCNAQTLAYVCSNDAAHGLSFPGDTWFLNGENSRILWRYNTSSGNDRSIAYGVSRRDGTSCYGGTGYDAAILTLSWIYHDTATSYVCCADPRP